MSQGINVGIDLDIIDQYDIFRTHDAFGLGTKIVM